MIKTIDINTINIILISFLLALVLTATISFGFIVPGLILTCYLTYIYGKKFLLLLTIFFYLLLTSEINETLRYIINVLNLIILVFLLIKEFGVSSDLFNPIPKEIKYYFTLVFISLFVSMIFSEYQIIGLNSLIRQLVFCLICFSYYLFIKTNENYLSILLTITIISLILGIGVVYQLFSHGFESFLVESAGFTRYSGLYENPNAVGLFYTVSIPLVLVIFNYAKTNNEKIIVLIIAVFLSVILLITNSRASIFAVTVSTIYILYKTNPKMLWRAGYSLFALILLIILIPQMQELFNLLFRMDRFFANTRTHFWSIALDIIKDNPIFGVGPGGFEQYIYKYIPVMLGSFSEQQMFWGKSGTAHNFFLFRAAELGILGLITGIGLFYIFFKYCNALINKFKNIEIEKWNLAIVIKGIGLGMLSRSLFESTGLLTHGWITRDLPFWLIFIILISIYKNTNTTNAI